MADKPLQQRAGRNIGIEVLPPYVQAAGSPEVPVVPGSNGVLGSAAVLMEAVENALRTPFTRGEANAQVFNSEASDVGVGVTFDDGQGNRLTIAGVLVTTGTAAPFIFSDFSGACPFTSDLPLCLCDGEKLLVQAAAAPAP